MPVIINVADMVDPSDPEGRTYREVNRTMKHALPVGALVELESGARLFVAELSRDCDQTPLYNLSPIDPVTEVEKNDLIFHHHLIGGYGIESLTIIKIPS